MPNLLTQNVLLQTEINHFILMKKIFLGFLMLMVACTQDADLASSEGGKSGSITRFTTYQGYMYVLNLNEVQTYSLSNPNKPLLVHTLTTDYGLETINIYDNTIFLGSTSSLYILDISDPAVPVLLSKTDRTFFFSKRCDPVVVKGNYAYSTIKTIENICGSTSSISALIVYDISNKTLPVELATYDLVTPNGLGYKDNYLFVCDEGTDRLEVFDISDPKQLVKTSFAILIVDPTDLIVDGDRMFAATKTDFQIFDVSDMNNIRRIGKIDR
jgi:hypothetical protein